jgi:prophage tail gpP-like protein
MDRTHEKVTVVANGLEYGDWEMIQIEWSIDDAIIHFILQTTEIAPFRDVPVFGVWNFPPGTFIEVYASGDFIVSGYVFAYMPTFNADQHTIVVHGRTQTYDWVASSVKSETGNYENTTDVAILQEWANNAGVLLENYTQPHPIPWYQIRQGATNYAEALRLLADSKKMIFATPRGSLALISGQSFGMSGALVQGENILEASAKLTDEEFYMYETIGNSPIGTTWQQHLAPFGVAIAAGGRRTRYKRIIGQSVGTMAAAKARAEWERMRTAGRSTNATIVTPSWRDASGKLWSANTDIYVLAPWLQIDCVLRATRVVFSQDLAKGSVTEITLVDARAIGGGASACDSNPIWDIASGWIPPFRL